MIERGHSWQLKPKRLFLPIWQTSTMSTAKATQEEICQLIEEHEDHTKRIFDPDGGVLVKNSGDSFMAVFDSATAALQACLTIVETKLAIGDREMALRASLATGDVEEMGGDYFGEAVNLSARINSKTPAGECWFANRTRLCMNEKSIPYETVGIFEFKEFSIILSVFERFPQINAFCQMLLLTERNSISFRS